ASPQPSHLTGVVPAPVVHRGYRYDSTAVIHPCPRPPSAEDVALDLAGSVSGSRVAPFRS
ncbi:hypothetical protein, partial [Nonomuraea zeae]|uniref:hypothetical protein n=1 Tax=Nonomuraea zeae TaxID=1642303 RepID=UPI0019809230